ncbi:MAG: MFS transporter [Bacteroidales bacterium]|nr:MFS transporter [Bacteroidales bacterium]MBQ8461917.1 MFS transporter [Bacteroidales bacterium]
MEQTGQDKLWNSNYLKVMTANFSMSFAFYLLAPLLPLYLSEHFGAGKELIGLVLSGYAITALLVRPFSGFLADSFPRKRVLLISLCLYFVFFGGYLVAGSIVLFAIVRTLHGGPFGAASVANSTMAIDVLPSSRRTEGIGYYGLSNNVATAIAPSVGLLVYQWTGNFDILFIIAFAVAGLGFWADSTIKVKSRQLINNKKALSLDRFFLLKGWAIGVNISIFGICYGVLSNYLAIYSKEEMGMTGGTGVFFLLLALGLIMSRLTGVRSLRQGKIVANVGQGVVFSTIGYLLFVACPNEIGYYGAPLLIGWGNGHFWPAFQNMIINVADKDERGTANSTLLTAWDLGVGVGIVLGGSLAENINFSFAFWAVAAIHIVGALFFIITRRDYLKRTILNYGTN